MPLTALVIATVLGVTAAFGGFAEAAEKPPPRLGPGAVVDQKLFVTKFVTARTVFQPDVYGGDGKDFVEIELEVTNKGEKTEGVGSPAYGGQAGLLYAKSILKVTPEIKSELGPIAIIPDEGVVSRQLHPGMTSTVVIRYELAKGQEAPPSVQLDVGRFDPDWESFTGAEFGLTLETDGNAEKAPPKVEAQVVLPVQRGGTGG
ncbi:hypothetical protein Pta02_49880 [Planobispora takensis]|uniref:DUF4352 domain-containing protein n=1 Tax=Planobispora takensis TaxID=1367882 RepID=A0A8J3WVE4_9ACTN|nr:hypothetical protein Pta02_49880 [Planobispora takensis]